jgi:hypothetical protein
LEVLIIRWALRNPDFAPAGLDAGSAHVLVGFVEEAHAPENDLEDAEGRMRAREIGWAFAEIDKDALAKH